MKQIFRTDFGRGSDLLNDVRMTLRKIRAENHRHEILHILVSEFAAREMYTHPRPHEVSSLGLSALFGHPVYMEVGLGDPGYQVVWTR